MPFNFNSPEYLSHHRTRKNRVSPVSQASPARAETRALIGGGEYSYLLVLPDEFLLKSVVVKVNFKRNSSGRTRIYI